MAQTTDFVYVQGLDQINKAISASPKAYSKAMHKGLLEAAEPVRKDADQLSLSGLSGMKRAKATPPPWSIQRKGQTIHEVYVAPNERGYKGKNRAGQPGYSAERSRKFRELMMGKSYEPALERNRERVVVIVDKWLGSVTREL